MHAGNASPIRGDRVFGPTVVAPFEIFFAEPRIQLMDFMYEEIGGESGAQCASATWHLAGTEISRNKPSFVRAGSHRKWLHRFADTLLTQAQSYIKLHEDCNHRSRSFVLDILQKPAWALTENEAKQKEEAEELDLIEFGRSLDPEAILQKLQASSDVPDLTQGEVEQPPMELDHSPQPRPILPDSPSSNFFSSPFAPACGIISPNLNPSDRHVVVSADVVRNMPRLVSNLPYLRLCPSV